MPSTVLRAGVELDIPDKQEIRGIVSQEMRQFYQLRGVKWMRLPQLSGVPSGSALQIGAAQQIGPDQGYAWCLRRLVVTGLTSGATPDIVNLFFNDPGTVQPIIWQFNGNNFGYTFGKLEITMRSGDTLYLKNQGTLAATGTIFLAGELVEMPAERLGELALLCPGFSQRGPRRILTGLRLMPGSWPGISTRGTRKARPGRPTTRSP
jgi:hypothetical protein